MKHIIQEQEIAIKFLFLGMAKDVIQLDIKNIKNGPFKIKEPYIDLLEKMHTMATNKRRDLHKIMWDKRIRIIFSEKEDMFYKYKLIYHGREEILPYNSYAIRKHVKEILEELMRQSL